MSALTETITWVPVSERLPDDDVDCVLAKWDDGEVQLISSDICEQPWAYLLNKHSGVTHWAELPKGPG